MSDCKKAPQSAAMRPAKAAMRPAKAEAAPAAQGPRPADKGRTKTRSRAPARRGAAHPHSRAGGADPPRGGKFAVLTVYHTRAPLKRRRGGGQCGTPRPASWGRRGKGETPSPRGPGARSLPVPARRAAAGCFSLARKSFLHPRGVVPARKSFAPARRFWRPFPIPPRRLFGALFGRRPPVFRAGRAKSCLSKIACGAPIRGI